MNVGKGQPAIGGEMGTIGPRTDDWLLSQAKDMMQPGDEALPGVSMTAKFLALDLLGMLSEKWEISEDGRVVVSDFAVHRMALSIAAIGAVGVQEFNGYPTPERVEKLAFVAGFLRKREGV